jgi:hypothetical protein
VSSVTSGDSTIVVVRETDRQVISVEGDEATLIVREPESTILATEVLERIVVTAPGPQGPPGTPGSGGGGGTDYYIHTQSSPASAWTVNHNLGHHPNISYVDTITGFVWIADVEHVTPNQAYLTFPVPTRGEAVCS